MQAGPPKKRVKSRDQIAAPYRFEEIFETLASHSKDENSSSESNASVTTALKASDSEAPSLPHPRRSKHPAYIEQGTRRKRKRQADDVYMVEDEYLENLAGHGDVGEHVYHTSGETVEPQAKSAAPADEDEGIPEHEALAGDVNTSKIEEANRTVFLSNVSIDAITSRTAKRLLVAHLSSVLETSKESNDKIQSIRFRSVPFSTGAIPKRAAFISKSLMEATTKSTNAYVVYSSTSAARLAVSSLNGTTILDRHLRVDSVAHPAPIDHRRCVFVGNLGFVDDEKVLQTKVDEDGKEKVEQRKRTKVPMDIEEGLWRTFTKHAGKVESVRVVRDGFTRVGKGIAYVQFYVRPLLLLEWLGRRCDY
jgi:nucleolar protein 12